MQPLPNHFGLDITVCGLGIPVGDLDLGLSQSVAPVIDDCDSVNT